VVPAAGGNRRPARLNLAALGIPSEAEVVARYCRLTGRDGIPGWEFYVPFALVHLTAIW
jgi:aminoglycoside phosphotransferase (APT) family kinase protein